MAKIYKTANVEEAVELAYKLKAEGKYDWFRGQVQDWPPHSSLYRLLRDGNSEVKEKYYQRLNLFSDWIINTPSLIYLSEEKYVNDVISIMQHYGIPTNYIDFTTDPGVAGFFASDTSKLPINKMSCIYCLNSRMLISGWNLIKKTYRNGLNMNLVKVDVLNLWRLQAQRGVFLHVDYNWEVDFPMDRILFPYTDYPSYPTSDCIYPEQKSPLEILLDQYFFIEKTTFASREKIKLVKSIPDSENSYWESFSDGFYEHAFKNKSELIRLKSWDLETLNKWENYPQENYNLTKGSTFKIKIRSKSTEELVNSLSYAVVQILRSEQGLRDKMINWTFSELPSYLSETTLNENLWIVWNGMRRLPYTNSDIANAFKATLNLLIELKLRIYNSKSIPKIIMIGFTNSDGSGSYAHVSIENLQRALRPDIESLIKPEYKNYAENILKLFQIIYNPSLMFDFNKLKDIFAREIIPTQVVFKRPLILFNPASLIILGNP